MFYLPEFASLHATALAVSLIMALCAWKRPRIGRLLYLLLFLWACVVNWSTALMRPAVYLDYGPLAVLDIFRDIIEGVFALHVPLFVGAIATGQGLIALGLLAGGVWARIAAAGAAVFLVAIAPLGVGSGFPATLIMAAGAIVLSTSNALSAPIWRSLRDEWRSWRARRPVPVRSPEDRGSHEHVSP